MGAGKPGELSDHTLQDSMNHHPMRTKFQDAFSGWLLADTAVTLTSAAESAALGALIGLGQQINPVEEMLSKPPAEDAYSETRSMLSKLGIESYEKNFIKGVLTDNTLPLLTDSALRDVSIPPGPRLLILDHIQRNKVANEGGRRA